MNIINKTVEHKSFGKGKICDLRENIICVQFGESVKKFVFPDAFREFLVLTEKQSRQYVDKILAAIDEAAKLQREEEQQELERRRLLRSLPLHASAQAAFGFLCNDRCKVQEEWSVSVGKYRSGYNRGLPQVPVRIYPNSACLLTHREKTEPEDKRSIWGVFMVREDFVGPDCSDGMIPAHEKYRILLTGEESEKLGFWKFFDPDEKSRRKWGLTEFKYFSNLTMARILRGILAVKNGTDDRRLCEEFFDYFCELNKIDAAQLL